jgi:hypothetical protein
MVVIWKGFIFRKWQLYIFGSVHTSLVRLPWIWQFTWLFIILRPGHTWLGRGGEARRMLGCVRFSLPSALVLQSSCTCLSSACFLAECFDCTIPQRSRVVTTLTCLWRYQNCFWISSNVILDIVHCLGYLLKHTQHFRHQVKVGERGVYSGGSFKQS